MLRSGSSGDEVTKLQNDLVTLGHDPGPADGSYGGKTVEAVRDFQRAKAIDADGVAGPATLGAIAKTLADKALGSGGPTPM